MALRSRPFGKFARGCVALVTLVGLLFMNVMPTFAAGGQTGNLQGLVVDSAARSPISGAAVTAVSPSGRYSARSDARGRFAIIGMTVDTYSVTITLAGYEPFTLSGVNVLGDNTVNLPAEPLQKSLQTIGRTRARTSASAYQPMQTVDSVSVSGQRATVALGKAANTSERALALSVPGVQLTNNNRLTIRGGLSTEIGYQLDGVDFTEPFLFGNANNGVSVGSSSLQVVEGAGDASQGGIGGGVVNSVLKRGTHPPFGLVDAEIGGPNYNHQAGFEYGFATPDGRISDYITYIGQRYVPYYGAFSAPQIDVANYDAYSSVAADDFVNNFVYRFGKNNNQSVQVAYLNHDLQRFGDRSGVAGRLQQNWNPYNLQQIDTLDAGDPLLTTAFFNSRFGLEPFATGSSQTLQNPELIDYNPSRYVKFEYTNSLTPTTFLDISTANVQQIIGTSNNYGYVSGDRYDQVGGQNSTLKVELTHSFNDKLTSTIGFNLDNKHPLWQDYDPFSAALTLSGQYDGASTGPSLADYALPANTSAPISATNPCPISVATYSAACYLYSAAGYAGRLPLFGINYNKTLNQEFGLYLRNQYNPFSRLHLDLGLRFDKLNWKQGANPFNDSPTALSNPNDVPAGIGPGNPPDFLRNNVEHPSFIEPRLAAAFQVTNNDSIRAGYGRSVIFPNAQSLGTPANISGLPSSVLGLAPTPGTNTADPSTWTCGSGTNPQWAASQSSPNYVPGGSFFRCHTYGQQLFWLLDQNHDAPDVGNNEPQTTSNTDLTYQHQFKNGMALKFTSYYKREFAVPAFALISQVLNPQGVPITQVFGVNNVGINKTSGLEFGLQSADHPTGFLGYVSATYANVIDSVPPLVSGEDELPLIPTASLLLGDTYRAGYVSPLVINLGAQYKFHNGFRINPVLTYDRGYPIGVGNLKASTDPFGGFANLPQSNLNPPTLSGYNQITGAFNATNYVDPVNPGTKINPNIAASRGTPETSAAGGILSRPRLNANITFEFTRNRNTFGLLVQNVFANQFGEPIPNPYYQPVATGIAGPQTGQTSAAIPGTVTYAYGGFRNIPNYIYGQSAYVLPLGAPGVNAPDLSRPLTFRAYYQLSL
jgi:hypothetical protein